MFLADLVHRWQTRRKQRALARLYRQVSADAQEALRRRAAYVPPARPLPRAPDWAIPLSRERTPR